MNHIESIASSRPLQPLAEQFIPEQKGVGTLASAGVSHEGKTAAAKRPYSLVDIGTGLGLTDRLKGAKPLASVNLKPQLEGFKSQSTSYLNLIGSVPELFRTPSDAKVERQDIYRLLKKNKILEARLTKAIAELNAFLEPKNSTFKVYTPISEIVAEDSGMPLDTLKKIEARDNSFNMAISETFLIHLNNRMIKETEAVYLLKTPNQTPSSFLKEYAVI